jgi:hypothetical protein
MDAGHQAHRLAALAGLCEVARGSKFVAIGEGGTMDRESGQASVVVPGPGRLQKVMVTILGSPQLRDVLLYTTLLLIVATAWVSNRWPDYAVPAIVTTLVLVSGEVLLLYFVIKRLRAAATDGSRGAGRPE